MKNMVLAAATVIATIAGASAYANAEQPSNQMLRLAQFDVQIGEGGVRFGDDGYWRRHHRRCYTEVRHRANGDVVRRTVCPEDY
ncbi:MAG TPA: hypothetical protein VHN11_10240 [Xanthobacteraceae bacterium]|nr:hypothetical protein [Xanthobacteraceae bacterium]